MNNRGQGGAVAIARFFFSLIAGAVVIWIVNEVTGESLSVGHRRSHRPTT
jgi:hypothetical protein